MNKVSGFLIIVFITILSTSCTHGIDGIYQLSKLIGEWNIDEVKHTVIIDDVESESESWINIGKVYFDGEFEGTFSFSIEEKKTSGTFWWFHKIQQDKLFINVSRIFENDMNLLSLGENIQIKNISIAWDMIENTNNTQRWGFIINSIVWDEDRGYQLTNPTERTEIIVALSK